MINKISYNQSSTPAFGMKFSEEIYKFAEDAGAKTKQLIKNMEADDTTSDLFVTLKKPAKHSKFKLFLINHLPFQSKRRFRSKWQLGYDSTITDVSYMESLNYNTKFDEIAEYMTSPRAITSIRYRMLKRIKPIPDDFRWPEQKKFIEDMKQIRRDLNK